MLSFKYVFFTKCFACKIIPQGTTKSKTPNVTCFFSDILKKTKTDHSGVQTRSFLSLCLSNCLPPACGLCSLRIWIRRGSSCACAWLHVLRVSVYRPGKCHRLAETNKEDSRQRWNSWTSV